MAALLLSSVLILMLLRWFEYHQVYHPYREMPCDGGALNRSWEAVSLTTSDSVRLNAWFFPADASSPRRQWSVVFCHGNGGNICHRLSHYAVLLDLGLNVLTFDYRGYGKSAGRPGEEGTYRDAAAAFEWLRQRGFAATNCLAYGESLGGGVATELASRVELGGLILQSTFTSVPDMGAELFPWLPVRHLASIRYETRSKLARLRLPVLILHSRGDTLVGFHHAERNFAAAQEPKLLWEMVGDHNDGPDADLDKFREGIEKFLRRIEAGGGLTPGR